MRPAFATTVGRGPGQTQAEDRVLDILVIALDHQRSRLQPFGLLTSQVHSIVRLDARDERLRPTDEARWELQYEGTEMPVRHLRQVLGLTAPAAPGPADSAGVVRILCMRLDSASSTAPRYVGFMVDEVIEIAGYSLATVRPFPRWAATALPPGALWGAITAEGNSILLLLDGLALAAAYEERQEP